MTAKEYLKERAAIQKQIDGLEAELATLREAVVIPPMDRLRPMTPADVREGVVRYGGFLSDPKYDIEPDPWWHVVEEVRHPDDDFKAYVADDGCRYGLHGAYVDKEEV